MIRLRSHKLPARSGVAFAILIAGLAFTAMTSIFAYRSYDANETRRFSEASNEVRDALETRVLSFESMLLQLAGLYSLNPDITSEEFHAYAENAGLPRKDRGVYTFGVFKREPQSSGSDKMTIHVHEVNSNLPYKSAKPGVDISGDPARMEAIHRATDAARPSLSGLITSLTTKAGRGYMMAAPAYRGGLIPETVDARRKKLLGIAYLRFSESGVFDIYQSLAPQRSSIDMEVFEGGLADQSFKPERRILDRFPKVGYDGSRASEFEILIGGVPFTIRLFSIPGFQSSFGLVLAFLLAIIGGTLSFAGYTALTRREERDQRLLQSQRQLKLVTDSLPAMIAYIDHAGIYRFNNKTYESFFEKPRAEITGRSVRQAVGAKNFAVMQSAIARALAGENVTADWSLESAQGVVRHFQVSLLPDINSEGNTDGVVNGVVNGVISMLNDITDRLKTQERAKFLGEFSTELAASLDPKQTTEKIASLLTPSLAQWCAIDLIQLDNSLSRVAASGHLKAEDIALSADQTLSLHATKSKEISRGESPASGQSMLALPLRSGDRMLGAVTLVSSHANHKFLEEDVWFAIEVALRASLAIENARLYSESQALNQAKDNFLAMLSHELRTPMNVILGWLEILSTEDVDNETYKQAIETLNRNARVQIQLINELLDVSRIINGKLTVHPKFCDMGEIAKGAIESVTPAARAKQIECSLSMSGDLDMMADPERIQQILWNLLSNALKFTPGGGKITVHVTGESDDVRLSVTDSGQGIDPSFLPFVFDRFRQEESSFARLQGGLGLGLSIVRYLAEAHGGRISVYSEGKEKGTCFTLRLPRSGVTDSIRLANSQALKA